ncbi:MAG: DUF488 domain-containing protein [Hyphomicrobiaceae bacterium]
MITAKRIYDARSPDDGYRVLVDRLWPRGIKREVAGIDHWAKAIAPSTDLRQWFDHRSERWPEFQVRYALELVGAEAKAELERLEAIAATGNLTLLTATRSEEENHAVFLASRLKADCS